MNAAATRPLAPSLRDRMAAVLGALDFSPPFALATDHCPKCRQDAGDNWAKNQATAAAVTAVREAPTDAAALRAYFDHWAALAGLGVAVEAVALDRAIDAGTENEMTIPGVGK